MFTIEWLNSYHISILFFLKIFPPNMYICITFLINEQETFLFQIITKKFFLFFMVSKPIANNSNNFTFKPSLNIQALKLLPNKMQIYQVIN